MGAVMAVIGTILKWIGIVLLWILGILLGLLVLFLVLLAVPFRVQAQGEYQKDRIRLDAEVTYLFRLVRLKAMVRDQAVAWQLRIAFWRIAGSEAPPAEAAQEPEKEPDEAVFTEDEAQQKVTQEVKKAERIVEEPLKEAAQPLKEAAQTIENREEEIPRWARSCMKPVGWNAWERFWENIGSMMAKVSALWNEYQQYPNKHEIRMAIQKYLRKLLHSLRLRNSVIHLRYGFEDPSLTGLLLGGASMAGQFLTGRGCRIELEPDFQNQVLEVNGQVRLHICILAIGFLTLRLALYRYVRRLILYILHRDRPEDKSARRRRSAEQN